MPMNTEKYTSLYSLPMLGRGSFTCARTHRHSEGHSFERHKRTMRFFRTLKFEIIVLNNVWGFFDSIFYNLN